MGPLPQVVGAWEEGKVFIGLDAVFAGRRGPRELFGIPEAVTMNEMHQEDDGCNKCMPQTPFCRDLFQWKVVTESADKQLKATEEGMLLLCGFGVLLACELNLNSISLVSFLQHRHNQFSGGNIAPILVVPE